ncbi:MAG: amidohydrolase family protein [Intestinibacter bartlettii]|uniref:amidohydrolase family protein n=1 Tax=Intestinibacter bartlettii TaxID=261299 RepID=UPI0026EF079A|nr:amidohydrolase family protein [Intestinibacter bartlettii]MDO5009709.1 amidohydrolase family protein [Intestinibacter bartlettii]
MNDNKFVSERGTIEDGVIIINNGKIEDIGTYNELKDKLKDISIYDYKDKVITPSLIDCHCHLLEYAPGSLYPVTKQTYLEAGKVLLFNALLSGITALGEQICGSPICNISIEEYMKVKDEVPLKIKFSLNSITIGTSDLSNYTCLNGNEQVDKNMLSNIDIVSEMAMKNEYPGENIFINATPANLPISEVPRAGEIMFTQDELKCIVDVFHKNGKKIGVHVAGKEGIDLALECGVDVLHHAHDINDNQINLVKNNKTSIVATPLGGTHLTPNLPSDILKLVKKGIDISIATDAYLPPAAYLNLDENKLYGSEMLMFIAKPSMELLFENGFNENECLALLTYNPAKILGLENSIGKLDIGMSADFLVTDGIPGLEITKIEQILCVFVNGQKLIER